MSPSTTPAPPPGTVLAAYAVFFNPIDFPGKWVVRVFYSGRGTVWAEVQARAVADTYSDARAAIPAGLVCLGRLEGDPPFLVETWL